MLREHLGAKGKVVRNQKKFIALTQIDIREKRFNSKIEQSNTYCAPLTHPSALMTGSTPAKESVPLHAAAVYKSA